MKKSRSKEKNIILRISVVVFIIILILGVISINNNTLISISKNQDDKIKALTSPDGNWDYSIKDGNAIIREYIGTNTEVVVPNKIRDYTVTWIEGEAFRDKRTITSITIEEGITTIGARAFAGCTALTNIVIPNTIMSIGGYAFNGDTALENIDIPDSVTSISEYIFSGCTSLKQVNLPQDLTILGDHIFDGCADMESITIPETVTQIGNYAFTGCKALTNLTIPDGVTSIGNYTFYNCEALTEITIPDGVTSIGDNCFNGCKLLERINLPETITSIGNSAFQECEKLESIEIPEAVDYLKNYTFYGCKALTEVNVPNNVRTIGNNCFENCDGLEKVNMTNDVKIIGDNAFKNCIGLTDIKIPSKIEDIGEGTFSGCISLTEVEFRKGNVTKSCPIKKEAFKNCKSLVQIDIPRNIYYIGDYAFTGCDALETITIPSTVNEIGQNDVFGNSILYCYIDTAGYNYCTSHTNEYEIIAGNVTEGQIRYIEREHNVPIITNIKADTNTKKVIVPEKLDGKQISEIPDGVIEDIENITKITILQNITTIGEHAFDEHRNIIIRGYSDSYAETYANEHNIRFERIDGDIEEQEPEEEPEPKLYLKVKDNKYTIKNGFISHVITKRTAEKFKSDLLTNGTLKILDLSGRQLSNKTFVGTGMKVVVTKDEETIEYTIIVMGDVSGDGMVTAQDLSAVNQEVLELEELPETFRMAADFDENEEITITDLSEVNHVFLLDEQE